MTIGSGSMPHEWRGASVFLDFDGTVTTYDTGLHLLERLARDEWRAIEDRYLSGEIGSRECMRLQWQLLPRDRGLIEAVAREVPLDPDFITLLDALRVAGAQVTILSDGYGFRAQEVASAAGVPVLTNSIDWDAFEVVFPFGDALCPCAACGTCKQAPIRAAQQRGSTTILIGDGASDAKAAEIADVVYAKASLATWCEQAGLSHHRFTNLGDLVALVGG
ncbi:MAG: HAD-IB family phosphatase [Mycobacteriales bacterium]